MAKGKGPVEAKNASSSGPAEPSATPAADASDVPVAPVEPKTIAAPADPETSEALANPEAIAAARGAEAALRLGAGEPLTKELAAALVGVDENDVFACRAYPDRVVVVTIAGRRLVQSK